MNWFRQKKIYLDYASATPVLKEVKEKMERYWSEDFYNPSAIYQEGLAVKRDIEDCRSRIARSLNVAPNGIIFTASGTESDHLAILGAFEQGQTLLKRPHIIISAIEHPAVVAAAEEVVRRGGEMTILPVNEEGLVSLGALKKLIKKNTFLISIGLANNEIGTIQPIPKIGRIVREYRKEHESIYPYLHTDASQATSYLNINLESLGVDLLTLDSSKIYGPKGIGLLASRRGVNLHRLRSSTANSALIVGFTLAFEIALRDREKEFKRLEIMRRYFVESIVRRLPKIVINGSFDNHLPNIVSVSLPGTLSEFVLLKLEKDGLMVSVGSACSYDEQVSGSPVIKALGKSELSESTLRFSFGRFTTKEEVERAVKIFCRVAIDMLK